MTDHHHTTSESNLPLLLRAGQTVHATRTTLEARFGHWSTEPVLCEDRRATLLTRLSVNGALYLTRTGEVLEVHPTDRGDVFQARLFTGSGSLIWQAVAALHPTAVPGSGLVPRYWSLREDVSPMLAVHGVYDLLAFQVIARALDPGVITRCVKAANSASRLSERGDGRGRAPADDSRALLLRA
jgi:hypothetical protein